MQESIVLNRDMVPRGVVVRIERRPARQRLWSVLAGHWLRRLDRRIEADLQWLDHEGVLADHRRACND